METEYDDYGRKWKETKARSQDWALCCSLTTVLREMSCILSITLNSRIKRSLTFIAICNFSVVLFAGISQFPTLGNCSDG
jgi:hypothetical protein